MSIPLNPRYRFETYVVGAANRLAATAAKAVAESPGSVYNPLFIYAGSGLGKTHLLMAIGHAALAINPQLRCEYLTLDEFVEAFNAAIGAGQGEAYRKRYAEVDLLLVDDVQFLTHRREMQAEPLRLTNSMLATGRQIVLSSDRQPGEISIAETATRLAVKPDVIYYWAKRGYLPTRRGKSGRRWVTLTPDLENYCRQRILDSYKLPDQVKSQITFRNP